MRTLTQAERAGMEIARDAIDRIIRDTPDSLHGEMLETTILAVLMASRPPVRDTFEAAAVTLAAMALARLVEHERGEREMCA